MNRGDCFAKADAALKEKVAKNRDAEAQRVEKLYQQIPRLRQIEDALKDNISKFAVFAFSGNKSEEAFNEFRKRSLDLQKERSEILIKAGLPQNAHERRFYCEKCKDVGYTEEGNCECFKRELSKQMLEISNLSAAYREKTFANFDLSYYKNPVDKEKMELTLGYAKRYVKNFKSNKENLLFMGRSGSGKTYLSCAIGIALAEQGNYVCYVSAQDMISEFEAEKFGKGDKTIDTRRYYDADLLIIDDLGSEFSSQFAESVIYNVVNSRLNSGKPMIISTNYRPSELSGAYHERIVSRLLNEFLTPIFADVDVRELKKLRR
ncbi:MAG: ATP-binding protein [Clostridia bacterium]|nr:ATP-binding protein [Clostridia bacterium]